MQNKFTTSTNIIRDSERELNYIPTPNSTLVVNQLASDFKKGIHSFTIIGSYGTGKSSFLWALQQSLYGKKRYFDATVFESTNVEVVNFIGDYKSITDVFAEYFNVVQREHLSENIFAEIYNRYHALGKINPLLIIVVDEFGKFLEYASQNSPEKELYFIQQLAEFSNNPDHRIIFLTTVHQSFDAYSMNLSDSQKQEWTKVKGRFREITFNEPVEQLLFLASEHLNQNLTDSKVILEIKTALSIAKKSKAYEINRDYATDISSKLFPLDLTAASCLVLSLQKYGQNERSLFSFLESTDHTGINNFNRKTNPFYSISCVYDYLIFNFYSFINSRYNPDFVAWSAIKYSLEEIERIFDENYTDYSKIIKVIGLLNITAAAGSDLGIDFLLNYSKTCLGINSARKLITNLENRKVIHYSRYNKRYILLVGTDLDISTALVNAERKVSKIFDITTLLNRYYQLPPVFAKAHTYLSGTPRMFDFIISDQPINSIPQEEIDGFINLIFNEKLSLSQLKQHSLNQEEAIIYGFYQNTKSIKTLLFEIEKTRKVIEENDHDKAAVKELNNILYHQQNLLNHYILNNLYSNTSEIIWIFKGEVEIIKSKRDFNKLLSIVCDQTYSQAPTFKNELVNKNKISNSIHTAKRNYLRGLVDNWNKPDLGFAKDKFPPEKTIYITLLKENGILLYSDELIFSTEVSISPTFIPLWNYSNEFLNSAKTSKRKISEFVEPLKLRPFKLKQGLIDFWIPSFLFIKRDDFALFSENGYIPYITDEVLELIIKYPEDYEIKTFDIEGVKLDVFNSYRIFLNQELKEKLDNQTFIETIKPFLTFYQGLKEYSKYTARLSKESFAIRDAIVNSTDPEKSFFEDFPIALGYSVDELARSKEKLSSYIQALQEAIRELRTCYDNLINRFEDFILEEFIGEKVEFEQLRQFLQKRFKKVRKHLCLTHQKTFLLRLDSQIDDKRAWFSSIAHSIIGKPLETIRDEDEFLLYDRFKTLIFELDSLTSLSKTDLNEEKEDVLGIEFSSFVDGIKKSLIRLPKTKSKEVMEIEDSIKTMLSKDKILNIAALANILKDIIKK